MTQGLLQTVVVAILISPQISKPDSLRTRARAEGGSVKDIQVEDFSEYPVTELSRMSEVIVHGKVMGVQSRLTADESTVVTDITVAPTRMLKQTAPVTVRQEPGPTQQLIVRHAGGTVVEDGLTMRTVVPGFPANEELTPGEEVICFLMYDAKWGAFALVDGPFAAFRVRQGRVHSLTKEAGLRLGFNEQPSVASFLENVDRYVRGR